MREIRKPDLRWLWAAYKLGLWRDQFDGELSDETFTETFFDMLEAVDYAWIVEAEASDGVRPVGLVMANSIVPGRVIHPHIDWFPWATPRNKLEGMAAFLRAVTKIIKIFVYVAPDAERFYGWFCRRRMLKGGCRITDHFARGEHAMFYYSTGP